jgi:hypothetical protein
MLEAQSRRELNLWQTCDEVGKKSSNIVPLGAPFFSITLHFHAARYSPTLFRNRSRDDSFRVEVVELGQRRAWPGNY